MASCGCSLLCVLALIMPAIMSLPNAVIQPNMDTVQNELQTTANLVLTRLKKEPMEINLPEPTDWMSFTYANGTAVDKLVLNFESIEKLLASAKFNVNIDVGKIAAKMIGEDEPLEPG